MWEERGRSEDSSHSATVRQSQPDASQILFALLSCQPVEYVLEYLCYSIKEMNIQKDLVTRLVRETYRDNAKVNRAENEVKTMP